MMTRTMPAQMEPAQKTAAEGAQQPAAADYVWPTFAPPKAPDLDTHQSPTTSNSHRQDQAPTDAQEETVWPVLTEAERAALPDRESTPWSAFLIGALALLFAGAIFKLARRHARSYRGDRWRMARPRLRQRRRSYASRWRRGQIKALADPRWERNGTTRCGGRRRSIRLRRQACASSCASWSAPRHNRLR
jgi:hypothetical protein